MIQAALFPAFNFVANNKWAQIALTAGLILIAYKWQAEHHEARGRRQANARSEKQSRRVQAKLRKKLDEKSIQADNTRAAVRNVPSASELPERTRSRFIRPD